MHNWGMIAAIVAVPLLQIISVALPRRLPCVGNSGSLVRFHNSGSPSPSPCRST